MIKSNKRNRSGITLLFVISMIVLFLLMGASFVIMSTQFRRSSVERARIQTRRDDARTLVNRAFYDLFRGPTLDDRFSPLRGHSILADQYGYGVRSTVQTATVVNGGAGLNAQNQFIVLTLDSDNTTPEPEYFESFALVPDHVEFSRQGGIYNGQVLTFVDGPAIGLSSRIISYVVSLDATGNVISQQFVLMPAWDDTDRVMTNLGTLVGTNVVINGREFAGTGAGFYTPPTDQDTAALSDLALLPNRVGEPRDVFLSGYYGTLDAAGVVASNPFGPNESYDAVDYQNMFLAAIRDDDGDGAIDPLGIIPSFHRESLIDYHEGLSGGAAPARSAIRVANGFNGGGATFPAIDADPDVDNDLDGINDGVWLDIGLPLQTDMKGRVYKPLVSYLVIDMDGKLNVNAHGSEADLDPSFGNAYVTLRADLWDPTGGGGIFSNYRGQGMGPAEVNLGPLFGFGVGTDYALLLQGGITPFTGTAINGRYGSDDVPGLLDRDMASVNKWYSSPNGTLGGFYGSPFDPMGRFGIGVADFARTNLLTDTYDPTSTTAQVPIGFPIIDAITSSWSSVGPGAVGALPNTELKNSPYEMSFRNKSFSPSTGDDTPFSPREMERVLRLYDPDAVMLPSRLREFTRGTVDASGSARLAFTTASFEVPVIPANLVNELRETLIVTAGLTLGPDGNLTIPEEELFVNRQVSFMLSGESIRGMRMDVNRVFGNGNDDDGDDLFDESWHPDSSGALDPALNESQAGELLFQANSTTSLAATSFDHDADGIANADPDAHLSRQHFARHLYILTLHATERVDRNGDGAITVAGDWYDYDDSGATDNDDWIAFRRDVAQWAINVVNFRDRDSVRHPFEVDLEPWNGWHVNGILDDDTLAAAPALEFNGQDTEDAAKDVMWGVERPEMVLSEVLALHDRRTEDLDTDDNTGDFTTDMGGTDTSLDNALVPNASFFLELYNPWIASDVAAVTSNNMVYPAELYDAGANGIDLQKTAPDGSPVWQVMVIHTDTTTPGVPANPDNGLLPEAQILRRIYFSKPDPTVDPVQFGNNKVYFPSNAISSGLNPLAPGDYAVAGSSGNQDGDRYHTYLGRRNTATWATELEDGTDETRRITLDTNSSELEITYYDTPGSRWHILRRPAVVIPVGFQEDGSAAGKARSVGVTDPTNGYDVELAATGYTLNPVADGFQLVDAASMPVVRDRPLDEEFGIVFNGNPEWPALAQDGMHNTDQLLRVVHLRCLANPQAAYDPVLNPYLTIDSMGLPVNSFNGASVSNEVATTAVNTAFGSRERGSNDADLARERLFWRADQNGILTAVNATPQPDMHFYGFNLANSLAEIDVAYRVAVDGGGMPSVAAFPWLNWNNRPFVSHMELANVPFTSSYWLLSRTDYEPGAFDDYDTFGTATADLNRDVFAGRFKHLPGFHADGVESARLHRALDYLEVPSRFVGTETYFNAAVFADGGTGDLLGFNPPFNKFSSYRYPGKINLNTIFDQRVWGGLMRNYNLELDYATFNTARAGLVGAVADYPTDFAAPFRAAKSANLVSEVGGGNPDLLVAGRNVGANMLSSETGMFRRGGANPLFDVVTNPGPHADPDRNAYFRYDMRQRLGNLVTNRSSVFSIWITIGFFEVDENLTIGAEVGSDTGEVQRYRGFYMVDRSIPVAFEPGFNHNVDQAILTSSITERAITRD